MFVTYFYGCWWLPAALTILDFDVVKFGKNAHAEVLMSDSVGMPKDAAQEEARSLSPCPPKLIATFREYEVADI
jgi:hypothetical protein